MKILYYSAHPDLNLTSLAGYGTHMREIIKAFRGLGHEVLPIIMGGTTEQANHSHSDTTNKPLSSKHIVKKIVPNYIWESLRDVNLLRKDEQARQCLIQNIETFKPDLIYERANYLQSSGVKTAKQYGIQHILEVNSPYVEEKKILKTHTALLGRARSVERLQLEWTNHIVVVSSVLKAYFMETHHIPDAKFIITPNAIDPNELKADDALIQEMKDRYGLRETFVLGFVGSIFRWHGVDILIQAFEAVSRAHSDLRLLIVGDGEILPELKNLAAHLGVAERVVFTGRVPHDQVFSHIALMDITVAANSHWYGSPVKIFEYGAMGKPVIAPDNLPVRDVIVPGEDAILVKPDKDDLIQAISRLYEDRALRARMATNFQEKVLKRFTWIMVAQKILSNVN